MAWPKISVVDDPLEGRTRRRPPKRSAPASEAEPPPEQAPASRDSEESHPEESEGRRSPRDGPDLRGDALVAVFGRVPTTLARRLEGVVFELKADRKVSQQDVLAALLLRYVDPRDERSLAEVRAALDAYYEARDGRRVRPAYAE